MDTCNPKKTFPIQSDQWNVSIKRQTITNNQKKKGQKQTSLNAMQTLVFIRILRSNSRNLHVFHRDQQFCDFIMLIVEALSLQLPVKAADATRCTYRGADSTGYCTSLNPVGTKSPFSAPAASTSECAAAALLRLCYFCSAFLAASSHHYETRPQAAPLIPGQCELQP